MSRKIINCIIRKEEQNMLYFSIFNLDSLSELELNIFKTSLFPFSQLAYGTAPEEPYSEVTTTSRFLIKGVSYFDWSTLKKIAFNLSLELAEGIPLSYLFSAEEYAFLIDILNKVAEPITKEEFYANPE